MTRYDIYETIVTDKSPEEVEYCPVCHALTKQYWKGGCGCTGHRCACGYIFNNTSACRYSPAKNHLKCIPICNKNINLLQELIINFTERIIDRFRSGKGIFFTGAYFYFKGDIQDIQPLILDTTILTNSAFCSKYIYNNCCDCLYKIFYHNVPCHDESLGYLHVFIKNPTIKAAQQIIDSFTLLINSRK